MKATDYGRVDYISFNTPYEKLKDIAPRLGVSPLNVSSEGNGVVICLKDGTEYDFFELIEAFLDRMDGVIKNDT